MLRTGCRIIYLSGLQNAWGKQAMWSVSTVNQCAVDTYTSHQRPIQRQSLLRNRTYLTRRRLMYRGADDLSFA